MKAYVTITYGLYAIMKMIFVYHIQIEQKHMLIEIFK